MINNEVRKYWAWSWLCYLRNNNFKFFYGDEPQMIVTESNVLVFAPMSVSSSDIEKVYSDCSVFWKSHRDFLEKRKQVLIEEIGVMNQKVQQGNMQFNRFQNIYGNVENQFLLEKNSIRAAKISFILHNLEQKGYQIQYEITQMKRNINNFQIEIGAIDTILKVWNPKAPSAYHNKNSRAKRLVLQM